MFLFESAVRGFSKDHPVTAPLFLGTGHRISRTPRYGTLLSSRPECYYNSNPLLHNEHRLGLVHQYNDSHLPANQPQHQSTARK